MATKVNALQFIGASPTKAGVSIWNQCQCCLGLRACRHTSQTARSAVIICCRAARFRILSSADNSAISLSMVWWLSWSFIVYSSPWSIFAVPLQSALSHFKYITPFYGLPIVYGRPYCNDAKEGVGGITPPKLNRGGWNSAKTRYFEGYVVCKNLGAIGSGAAEGRRKTSLGDPKKTWLFSVDTTTHDLTHFPSADFHEIFTRTRGSVRC